MENNSDDILDSLRYLHIDKWDPMTLKWYTSQLMNYEHLDLSGFTWSEYEDKEIKPQKPTHCECGKDKHGFASHSNWCPKENV